MKIQLELDGTPDQLRDFLRGGKCHALGISWQEASIDAAELLESAVKDGHATILLGPVTESRQVAAAV